MVAHFAPQLLCALSCWSAAVLPPVQTGGSLTWTYSDGGLGWIGRNVALGNLGNEVLSELSANNQAAVLLSSNDTDPPSPLWVDGSSFASSDQHVASAETSSIHVTLHTFDRGTANAQTVLSKYTTLSGGIPDWTYAFPSASQAHSNCAISRDGQTIVAAITSSTSAAIEIAVFGPGSSSPSSYSVVSIPPGNFLRALDLSADGSTLYFAAGSTAHIFDIASASVVFMNFLGSGQFESHAISGDGSIYAFGRYNQLRVYEKMGSQYFNTFTRILAGSNWVEQVDISDDNSTIAYAFTFYDQYLTVRVEALDVPTKTVTMTDEFTGLGNYQNIASSLAICADGSRFAVGVLGDQGGTIDELRLYSRSQSSPLATIDLPGSVLDVAISADGTRVAAASKSVHANAAGDGGRIDLFTDLGSFETFCFGDDLDPSVSTDCPCLNFGFPGYGCGNSVHPGGARLLAAGKTAPDTLQLTLANVPAYVGTIYLQGDLEIASGALFGDGVRCAGGNLIRLGLKIDLDGDGITTLGPSSGDPQISISGSVNAGSTYFYQAYYRNPAPSWCPPATFNISQGIQIAW